MLEADGLPRPAVLPFAWQKYPSGGPLLDRIDLASELLEPYNHGADGLILWGDDSGAFFSHFFGYISTGLTSFGRVLDVFVDLGVF